METAQRISTAKLAAKVGTRAWAVVDEIDEDGDAVARTASDAPEIDGNVFVEGEGFAVGETIRVEITDASEYDLFARRI